MRISFLYILCCICLQTQSALIHRAAERNDLKTLKRILWENEHEPRRYWYNWMHRNTVNALDEDVPYTTPLQLSVLHGHDEAAHVLIDHGANVNTSFHPQTRALETFHTYPHLEYVRSWTRTPYIASYVGASLLTIAFSFRDQSLVQLLCAYHADPNNGIPTPIWMLVEDMTYDVRELHTLLEQGANVNEIKFQRGVMYTPLSALLKQKHGDEHHEARETEKLRLLISYGAEPFPDALHDQNEANKVSYISPLQTLLSRKETTGERFSEQDDIKVALLLASGDDPDRRLPSPFLQALQADASAMAKRMLQYGATWPNTQHIPDTATSSSLWKQHNAIAQIKISETEHVTQSSCTCINKTMKTSDMLQIAKWIIGQGRERALLLVCRSLPIVSTHYAWIYAQALQHAHNVYAACKHRESYQHLTHIRQCIRILKQHRPQEHAILSIKDLTSCAGFILPETWMHLLSRYILYTYYFSHLSHLSLYDQALIPHARILNIMNAQKHPHRSDFIKHDPCYTRSSIGVIMHDIAERLKRGYVASSELSCLLREHGRAVYQYRCPFTQKSLARIAWDANKPYYAAAIAATEVCERDTKHTLPLGTQQRINIYVLP